MPKYLLALTLTFLTPSFAALSANSPYFTYSQPTVTQKVRFMPNSFFLHLSNGELIQVTEVQYNKNTIGRPFKQ